ncbi:MAG: tetratricopeptide repeat protein [Pseudomonadales bacterium]|nr:tetratricopeptide repeat protein [Pseudomonadales bacterium]
MNVNLQQLLQTAATHFSSGRMEEAEELCRQIVQQAPEQIDCLHMLALINKNRDSFAIAENYFLHCLQLDGNRADIRSNLGNLYTKQGKHSDAQACFESALSTDKDFRQARLALARLLNKTEEFDNAGKHIRILLEQNPNDHEALVALGNCLKGKKKFDEAEQAYKRALGLKPEYGAASHNLGALYVQTNQNQEALTQLQHAASCGVSGVALLTNYVFALMGLGKFSDAESALNSAITSGNRDVHLLELITKLRYMNGEEDFAAAFEESIKLKANDPELRIAFTRLLQGAEEFTKAEECLVDYLDSQEENAAIRCSLAATQTLAGKYEQSLENTEAAEKLDGNNQRSLALMIDALMCLGEANTAQKLIAQGRARFPKDQWYLAMEATAARMQGDSRYQDLYDYENFVKEFELEAPEGWASISAFNADLLQVLRERHRFNAHPLDQSLRHGTQTPTSLLADTNELIQSFLKCLNKPIASYRDQLGFSEDHPLRSRNKGEAQLIGCWSVCLRQEGYHVNHVHPEGWLSSAYYVETPAEIETSDSHAGWLQFGAPRFSTPGADAVHFVKPEAGKLALFPSYMWHGTVPIKGTDPRTTIAFDVVTVPDSD